MFDLLDKFKVYVFAFLVMTIVVITLASIAEVSYLKGRITKLEDANVTLRTRNVTLEGANALMAKDVDTQNKALAALKKAQEDRTAAAEKALSEVTAERNKWRDRYAVLFGVVPDNKDVCVNVASLLEGYFTIRKEETAK